MLNGMFDQESIIVPNEILSTHSVFGKKLYICNSIFMGISFPMRIGKIIGSVSGSK